MKRKKSWKLTQEHLGACRRPPRDGIRRSSPDCRCPFEGRHLIWWFLDRAFSNHWCRSSHPRWTLYPDTKKKIINFIKNLNKFLFSSTEFFFTLSPFLATAFWFRLCFTSISLLSFPYLSYFSFKTKWNRKRKEQVLLKYNYYFYLFWFFHFFCTLLIISKEVDFFLSQFLTKFLQKNIAQGNFSVRILWKINQR